MIAVEVPVKVMVVSEVPSPVLKVSPVVPLRLMTPLVAVRVTVKFVLSTSATEIRLPFALEKTLVVSSLKVCVVGIVATGESFTALTVILIVSLSVKLPSVV